MSARASAALLVVSLCLMAADPPDDRVPPKAGKARGPNCDPDHGLPAAAVARLNIPRFGPGAFIAFAGRPNADCVLPRRRSGVLPLGSGRLEKAASGGRLADDSA